MNVSESQPLLVPGVKKSVRQSSASNSVRSAIAASLIVGCVVAVVAVSGNSFVDSSTLQTTSTSTTTAVKIPIAVPTEKTDWGDVADGVADVGTSSARVHDAHTVGRKKSKDKSATVIGKVASSSSSRSHHASSSVEDVAVDQKSTDRVARDPKPLVARIGEGDAASSPAPGPASGDDYDADVSAPAADASDDAAAPGADILEPVTKASEMQADTLEKREREIDALRKKVDALEQENAQLEDDADGVAPTPSVDNGDEKREKNNDEEEAEEEEEEEALPPTPNGEAIFTDEVFRADIAHGASDALIDQIMLQKAVDHGRPADNLTLSKFTFFVRFTVTVGGDVDCKHVTPESIEKYITVGSTFVGHAVKPRLVGVGECRRVSEGVTEFRVKIYIPRVDTSTDPTAQSAALMALFTPSTFRQAFGAVDESIKVETVETSQVVVHGEITVKMSPVAGGATRLVLAQPQRTAVGQPDAAAPNAIDVQKFKEAMRKESLGGGKNDASKDE